MKGMRKLSLALFLALAALLVGCERRPLESPYRPTIRVVLKCVWTVKTYPAGEKPSGVTMYFFRDGAYYNSITTANVDSCEVQLPEGHYRMYMISQSPEEYWKMEFDHMNQFESASTTLRRTDVSWATATRTDDSEMVVENPEVMCAGVSDEFDITTEMTEDYQYYYTNLKKVRASNSKTRGDYDSDEAYFEDKVEYYTLRIPVYPKNIVSQLWVSIYAGNADVLKSVRATMSGMARTFELTQGTTGSDKAIQIINQWTLTMDDPETRVGHVDGIITTFGLPNGEKPSAVRDSTLNVSTLLVDNSTVADYVFSVGDKIRQLPPNEGYRNLYRVVFGDAKNPTIVLPDVKPPSSGGGGFTGTVEDWEDETNVDIIL